MSGMTKAKVALPAVRSPRWKRRAEARPEEILDAALAEFNERGFDAARMEDIARRAGISKAAIYLYFKSKTAVLEALIEARVAPLARQAEQLAQNGADDPIGTMRAIANVGVRLIADPQVFAVPRLVMGISGRFPQIADYYRSKTAEALRGALESLIAAAIKAGKIRPLDPRAVARAFIGPIIFEAMWTHVLRGESAFTDPDTLINAHFDILLNGLRA